MSPRTAEAFAPAKINLTLHVTGRRADRYHLLDSLVIFADLGDRVVVREARETALRVTGPRGRETPADASNLALRAARLMNAPPLEIILDKRLPVAAGLGGGSSDAAATLRAIAELTGSPLPGAAETAALGADLPVCLAGRPARMTGIGDVLAPAPSMPPFHLVLANPCVGIPTGSAFEALERKNNPPMPGTPKGWSEAADLAAWLSARRNDLEAPARALAPVIGEAVALLHATSGCLLARMTGSGATCFAIYAERREAEAAAAALQERRPEWWFASAAPWAGEAHVRDIT